ncbi:MAG: cytochrome c [Deltaproteobacteria bacterium]|nr:cytochrome c [Deltaproteobacteria bacterium]
MTFPIPSPLRSIPLLVVAAASIAQPACRKKSAASGESAATTGHAEVEAAATPSEVVGPDGDEASTARPPEGPGTSAPPQPADAAAADPGDAAAAATPDAEATAAEDAPAVPAIDAAALVQSRCTRCHTAARIERARGRDRDWWDRTVGSMVRKGARINDEERAALVEYLSTPVE